jgi:hypothetical protein
MARQGLKELRAALYSESNIAQATDYGIYGMSTPGEVAQERQGETPSLEEEHGSTLGDKLKQAEASRDDPGREDREHDGPELDR